MTFTLTIELGDAAMQTLDDVFEAINEVHERLTGQGEMLDGTESGRIRDINGNRVGKWEVVADGQ